MTGRILVVDDVEAIAASLAAQLSAEYFEVDTAADGASALTLIEQNPYDAILLDVMMPDMDGFEVCQRVKVDPNLTHIPVILITALRAQADRIRGLQAGADDFISKPVVNVELITRVRNLARLKRGVDELRMRMRTSKDLSMMDQEEGARGPSFENAQVLLVDDNEEHAQQIKEMLSGECVVTLETDAQQAVNSATLTPPEVILISGGLEAYDPLRLCSQIRSMEYTRSLPIVLLSPENERKRLLKALDLGVNDFVEEPVDPSELKLRVRAQVKQKRTSDRLLATMQQTMELAVTDALTGLYNRRYFEHHLKALMAEAERDDTKLALAIVDIDHFKRVNDTYGHDVGDEVLVEFSKRLRMNVRGVDLVCRLGGEEFVIVMPQTSERAVMSLAERIREEIAFEPFKTAGAALEITASFGVAMYAGGEETPASLVKNADEALYQAKDTGRNRVIIHRL
ncbi:PleD family two-component system response regulator [Rhodobacteraceae bacterium RKSG542]|uniref:PleD family two-component system response regulator n=1 Tax=Pseudovibrio flavus TaxID=2529854 RepID=UPI0012BCCD2A|nr:PleD family two-component system response regulator [Pseudovibrio flavus]MTI16384.1 PleD family two-component system response regulator [Pseudovibrio flavus]